MNNEIKKLVDNAAGALAEYMKLSQEQVDKICHQMALAALDAHFELAKLAVAETGRGIVEDKVIKNIFAAEYIWNDIKDIKTVGVIEENEAEGYEEIAEPVGVVAGITPVTNPTSTTVFKSLICAKARNPIIFAFHPSAQKSSSEAARIIYEAALKAGAPKHCIQWIENPSIEATNTLMNDDGVALILATGGSGMVKSAYSAGKPALGVGPGNVPCYINKNVNLRRACTDVIMSKTFDNGTVCASEQAVICDREIAESFVEIMKEYGCYFTSAEETEKLTAYAMRGDKGVNPDIVGKSAALIAERAGIDVPAGTKILIAALPEPDKKYPLSLEKLSPILAFFTCENPEQGFAYAKKMLKLGGMGHSAVIHSDDAALCRQYGLEMQAGRIIVNSPSTHGAIGDIYNANTPSLTLGCGSYGKNSTASNISSVNLINKKRVAGRRVNMQWFKIPPKIYFERGSAEYLRHMPDISRAFIVTDPVMAKLGYVDKILYFLRARREYCHSEVFSEVESDPSVETVMRGVNAMNAFKPDVIIALGGGSAMDAAKGMWLFYEHPETDFENLRLRFMDIRKRAFRFPELSSKAKMVCIPTTSGTGSEVTSFAVITDRKKDMKYPLADYELTPDVAIIDPQFADTMPRSIAADTGLDVLTHAIEAYVSVLASDYTNGLAIKAIALVLNYLERSCNDPGDKTAREKMHNASCIAGMAFSNAFLGINHSLAHKLGGEFHIPHGRANAVLLPYVIRFNAGVPTKFNAFPKYEEYRADKKYAEISRYLGLGGETEKEQTEALIFTVSSLMERLSIPKTIKECGVGEKEFLAALPKLSENAFEDQCTTANPRYPLISEIEEIYRSAYYGK